MENKVKTCPEKLALFLNNTCKYRTKQTPKIMTLFNTDLVNQIPTCKIRAGQELLCLTQLMGADELNLSGKHSWFLGQALQSQPISLSLKRPSGTSSEGCVTGRCLTQASFISAAHCSPWAWQIPAGNNNPNN